VPRIFKKVYIKKCGGTREVGWARLKGAGYNK